MANKALFQSLKALLPRADARNEAGGPAYRLAPKHALAQLAATGCLNGTYYATAETQLDALQGLIAVVDDDLFLAKLAIYGRERAFLKDLPAALVATLAARDTELFHRAFDRVVDNGRVLRTLFQMIRSGRFGKKSLTSSVRRAFRRCLNGASVEALLSASIGKDPSLRDVLRMARPKPADDARRALFGRLTDKPVAQWAPATERDLPEAVRLLAEFRAAETAEAQVALLGRLRARWDLLADAARGPQVWAALARTMGPQALRMNLNTLQRQGAFADDATVRYVAERLGDAEEVRRARQFPYQYFAAYKHASAEVPAAVKAALHRAAETACGNVPELPGPVVIGLDVSGSMQSPVTGVRGSGATTAMRCVDVAALVAAALLRRNPDSVVIPFDLQAFDVQLDPSDSILSLADRLSQYGGGGTDCSLPLRRANERFADRRFAGAVLVSDNESWSLAGRPFVHAAGGSTGTMAEWTRFVRNQVRLRSGDDPGPKLICIDLQPYATVQAPERSDILHVGGFGDAVFHVIAAFLADDADRFVTEVESVTV